MGSVKPDCAAVHGLLDPFLGKAAVKRQRVANCIRIVRPDYPFELNDLQLQLHALANIFIHGQRCRNRHIKALNLSRLRDRKPAKLIECFHTLILTSWQDGQWVLRGGQEPPG